MNSKLLYKYLENTATEAEMREVVEWLDADPAHRRELDSLDTLFNASILYGPKVFPAAAVKPRRGLFVLRRIARYAVGAAAVVAISAGIGHLMLQKRIDAWAQRTTSLEIPAGHYVSMKLEDGTTVWLNSGSRLEYPLVFAGGERRVKISGEAMFDVAPDKEHPFIVETFAYDVEVLGTQFNVLAEEQTGTFATSLIRGSVKVFNRLAPEDQFTLKPNQEARLIDGHLSLRMISDPEQFLWTQGIVSVKGLGFAELMRKFERSYGVRIIIDRKQMPVINYNHGKIRVSDGIDSALHLLQMASDFTYRKTEDNTTIIIQ